MITEIEIPEAASLKDGETVTFQFQRDGIEYEGFVVRHTGRLFAFENRCRHLPLPLDYGDGKFLSADGDLIVCASHGATYEPDTGRCVAGPCQGARLKSLPFAVAGDRCAVRIEDSIEP